MAYKKLGCHIRHRGRSASAHQAEGAVPLWNKSLSKGAQPVLAGDRVLSINGTSGDPKARQPAVTAGSNLLISPASSGEVIDSGYQWIIIHHEPLDDIHHIFMVHHAIDGSPTILVGACWCMLVQQFWWLH